MKTRREFLQAGTLFLAPAFLPGGLAANERIRVGIAGVKGRGWALLRSLLEIGKDQNVEVAALCDVDAEVLSQRAAACEKLNGGKRVATMGDMRRMTLRREAARPDPLGRPQDRRDGQETRPHRAARYPVPQQSGDPRSYDTAP
jgi:hypothetical protein